MELLVQDVLMKYWMLSLLHHAISIRYKNNKMMNTKIWFGSNSSKLQINASLSLQEQDQMSKLKDYYLLTPILSLIVKLYLVTAKIIELWGLETLGERHNILVSRAKQMRNFGMEQLSKWDNSLGLQSESMMETSQCLSTNSWEVSKVLTSLILDLASATNSKELKCLKANPFLFD